MSVVDRVAVRVRLGERSYPVLVGMGLSRRIGEAIDELIPGADGCVLVTSPTIDGLHSKAVVEGLKELSPVKLIVPDGEDAKTWATAEAVINGLIERGLNRGGVVVALGGGAVGDVAGFAASIYLRGVRVVQVPTTLLGMVDSSIGGKTAVNHPGGKNLVGSFHQPGAVVIDPTFLETLPVREIRSGLGEAVKYGVIKNPDLFRFIEDNGEALLGGDLGALTHIAEASAKIKAGYVEADERDEKGVRAALNLGHTLGHAVERLSPSVRHGEAVSIGMVYASKLAAEKGLMKGSDEVRLGRALAGLGLPTEVPELSADDLIALMRRDKKAARGGLRFVLPRGIGAEPVVTAVDEQLVREALSA